MITIIDPHDIAIVERLLCSHETGLNKYILAQSHIKEKDDALTEILQDMGDESRRCQKMLRKINQSTETVGVIKKRWG